MGLSYHFKFSAPGTRTAWELEGFLRTVEKEAQALGFKPTMVLNASFDTDERRNFSRRLTNGYAFESPALGGRFVLGEGQVWDHHHASGECRLIPERGVVLVVTDEQHRETILGFFQYAAVLKDLEGRQVATTGAGDRWVFMDFVDSPDPRFRELVRLFMEGGFLEEEEDDFADEGSTYIYIPPSENVARDELSSILAKPLKDLGKRDFLRAYCSLAYLHPGFHPDGWEDWDGPAEIKPLLAEAWRRAGEGHLTDNELYPYQAVKTAVIHSWRGVEQN